jgi:hypothetical protein
MTIAKLNDALRALGWMPRAEQHSVSYTVWVHETDARPEPATILVPCGHWVAPRIARRLLRRAAKVELR